MLSIERLKVVNVQDLKPGDIARLPEQGNSLVICTLNERSPLIFLEGPLAPFAMEPLDDFYGPAIVYPDVSFEVCTSSGTRSSADAGDLSLYAGKLVLTGQIRDRRGDAVIRSDFSNEVSHRLFFAKWRAVIRDGDQVEVLFDRNGPQSAGGVVVFEA